MKHFFLAVLLCACALLAKANYTTPGTGIRWNLSQLALAAGNNNLSGSGNSWLMNDSIYILPNDTLYITTNDTVRFAPGVFLSVKGVLTVNPPTQVVFTAQNITSGFFGVWIDGNSGSMLKKLTFEYGNSVRLFNANILIDSCTFHNCSPLTNFGNAAISLFQSSPMITNSSFVNNQRAAIAGGANISNAPRVMNCLFMGNNTLNQNVPQINLGASGADTVKIIGNRFLRASYNSGAIGFLPLGTLNAVITGNLITENRYGITFSGGSNIYSLVNYNIITNNNIDNNPNTGGSGISYSGGSATSRQNSIVTGNYIAGNLWGITVLNRAMPNLGNLNNADTTDDGKNYFVNNTNNATPNIDLYNNTPDTIYAQNNYWGSIDTAYAEQRIFHKPDNAALGIVIYKPTLAAPNFDFSVSLAGKNALLQWNSVREPMTVRYIIERSRDTTNFVAIDSMRINRSSRYSYVDSNIVPNTIYYYRIRTVNAYNVQDTSAVRSFYYDIPYSILQQVYPTAISNGNTMTVKILAPYAAPYQLIVYAMDGKKVMQQTGAVQPGGNTIYLRINNLPAGMYVLQANSNGLLRKTQFLVK